MKKTLVFGASLRPDRASHQVIMRLRRADHQVIAIGGRKGQIYDTEIEVDRAIHEDVHTITVYMGEKRIEPYEDYILSLNPKRLIFNPGAENSRLSKKAIEQGIEVENACTLVMLSLNEY